MLTFFHPGSRIQGSKMYPIPDPDPQHCCTGYYHTLYRYLGGKFELSGLVLSAWKLIIAIHI
jgi:hypothetical protein